MLLRKQQIPDKPQVYRDIKPTLCKVGHRFTANFGVGGIDGFLKEDDILAMLPTDSKIPDFHIRVNLFSPLTEGTVTSVGGTHTCTVNQNGLVYHDGEVPAEITNYESFVRIEGIESLQEISVNIPDVPQQYVVGKAAIQPEVLLYLKISGIPGEVGPVNRIPIDANTKMATFDVLSWRINGVAPDGVTCVIRWSLTITPYDLGGSGLWMYPFWSSQSAIHMDFNNAWEDPLVAGSVGVVTGLVGSAFMIKTQEKLAEQTPVIKLAAALGTNAMELAGSYLGAMVYFTAFAKTRTLEDFSMDELLEGPTLLASILKIGVGAAFPILRQLTGDHRAKQISSLLSKALLAGATVANVVASIGVISAYLTTLGTNKYWFYWS